MSLPLHKGREPQLSYNSAMAESRQSSSPDVVSSLCSSGEADILEEFKRICSEQGLLLRPAELSEEDVLDGIADDVTLLYRLCVMPPT
jgi:hypothetical protein